MKSWLLLSRAWLAGPTRRRDACCGLVNIQSREAAPTSRLQPSSAASAASAHGRALVATSAAIVGVQHDARLRARAAYPTQQPNWRHERGWVAEQENARWVEGELVVVVLGRDRRGVALRPPLCVCGYAPWQTPPRAQFVIDRSTVMTSPPASRRFVSASSGSTSISSAMSLMSACLTLTNASFFSLWTRAPRGD